MKYFNGFGIQGEYVALHHWLQGFGFSLNQYDIVGFDYGTILAFKEARERILNNHRVGKLILISPYYFADSYMLTQQDQANLIHSHIHSNHVNTTKTPLSSLPIFITHNEYCYKSHDIHESATMSHFIDLCLASFALNPSHYLYRLYKGYGLKKQENTNYFYASWQHYKISTFIPNFYDLRNFLLFKWQDIEKITKKCYLFIILFTENDKISSLKLISDYFSQFGVCYIIKNHKLFNAMI